ncbi:hypothetical protein C2845_PM06G25790 [Panicum miliaceum]|uniref:BTB domain-containing protein n=1 Tax=Panicum miliaceum TaxID=4540 RepID=A0A3L6RFT0_PANMI|nr:hypothetical protein C2845_PM06G25790 [Panicum miliaceum]
MGVLIQRIGWPCTCGEPAPSSKLAPLGGDLEKHLFPCWGKWTVARTEQPQRPPLAPSESPTIDTNHGGTEAICIHGEFVLGGHRWRIKVFPTGVQMEKKAIRSVAVWLEIMEDAHEIKVKLRLLIGEANNWKYRREVGRAHKSVLAARSDYFKSLLFNGMSKTSAKEVPILGVSGEEIDAFKATVEFLYAETLPLENLWTSVDEALASLMKLADKFLMDSLKLYCARKMWDRVEQSNVISVLSLSLQRNCVKLQDKCNEFISRHENFEDVTLTHKFSNLGHYYLKILDCLRKKRYPAEVTHPW